MAPTTTRSRARGARRRVRPVAHRRTNPPPPARKRFRWRPLAGLVLAVAALAAAIQWSPWRDLLSSFPLAADFSPTGLPSRQIEAGMVLLAGGRFTMGTAPATDPACTIHDVVVSSFWIDEHEVTGAQFAEFVEATGHITTAEQLGYGLVFDPEAKRWRRALKANWREPGGPETTIVGRENQPVVQVSWYDATAYAIWAEKRLPTEAEWEYAARGGLSDAEFPWGRSLRTGNRYRANYWQGPFPFRDDAADGFRRTAPAGSFEPNPYGLYDMAGNVAEWCADWYAADYYPGSPSEDPPGASDGSRRVVRGGSWVSTSGSGAAYKVWVRESLPPGEPNNHTGFRCVRDVAARR